MGFNVAVIGATGLVGGEMIKILEEDFFAIKNLYPLASRSSIGREISFLNKNIKCLDIDNFDYSQIDIALFAIDAQQAKSYVPKFSNQNVLCIDNSSYFRMHEDVPLVVPEVNSNDLHKIKRNIIANPNCTTTQLAVALKPLHDQFQITRVVCSTYQAVSGAGRLATDELFNQTRGIFVTDKVEIVNFPKQIAFNVIPKIGDFQDDGSTEEEWKIMVETKKIIDKSIKITSTCVRVPVFVGHSICVNIATKKPIEKSTASKILRCAPGLVLLDNTKEEDGFVTPVEIVGDFATYVSRVRVDPTIDNGLNFWVVSDNLRKGAALNAVQIAQSVIKMGLIKPKTH